jgi:hypothetical protein
MKSPQDPRRGSCFLWIHLVKKISTSRSPRVLYTSGPAFEVFAVKACPCVPVRVFEWAMRKYYRLE